MPKTLFMIGDLAIDGVTIACAAVVSLILVAFLATRSSAGARRREAEFRSQELDMKMAALAQSSAELSGRMQTVAEVLGSRQSDLARLVTERLDAVGHRVGQGLETSSKASTENLTKLNERLAVIDSAQARLTVLTQEVLGLKDILANKQARGAFGQGRMEAIIRDALPSSAYEFQHTLSNRSRPDCCIRLPGDDRMMVVDAKFPLEAFSALKAAEDDTATRAAMARVRTDVGKHIKDIADRYFLPGETQDIAMLFVPSESLYAEINETFDDLVARAHKARIVIVSPSLLMMAVQVMQAIVRDARVREQAHLIQDEVRKLVGDVGRLHERIGKLATHIRQAGDDVAGAVTSSDKILKRGERIDAMDFTEPGNAPLASYVRAAE